MACEVIATLGEAQGAASAEQAIDLFNRGNYDILFTDLGLPGMNSLHILLAHWT
jgi:CheY-like chemotaxis protein